MLGKELAVFPREDVVGHSSDVVLVAKCEAQGEHQGGLAGADWSTSSMSVSVISVQLSTCQIFPGHTHQCL